MRFGSRGVARYSGTSGPKNGARHARTLRFVLAAADDRRPRRSALAHSAPRRLLHEDLAGSTARAGAAAGCGGRSTLSTPPRGRSACVSRSTSENVGSTRGGARSTRRRDAPQLHLADGRGAGEARDVFIAAMKRTVAAEKRAPARTRRRSSRSSSSSSGSSARRRSGAFACCRISTLTWSAPQSSRTRVRSRWR